MRSIVIGIVVALGSVGCCGPYKDALCKLSTASSGVAVHYEGYVEAEPDPATKAARQAEVKQFKEAVQEANGQCAK